MRTIIKPTEALGTLQKILDEFEISRTALSDFATALKTGTVHHPFFVRKSFAEVDEIISQSIREQELLFSLKLIAFAEGNVKIDFNERLHRRLKDDVTRQYREIKDGRLLKNIGMEEILDIWKTIRNPQITNAVGNFKSIFKFRHWVAHGRFWHYENYGQPVEVPLSPNITLPGTFRVCNRLLKILPLTRQRN